MSDKLVLAGFQQAEEAHLMDGTVLTSVEFVRSTGYDTTLWVKGLDENKLTVLAPRDMVVKVVV